jgi:hypothetical protein
MKQIHRKTSKHHTLYTLGLVIVSVASIILLPQAALFIGLGFLALYIAGNGLIHYRNGTGHRDVYIEYAILVFVGIVIIAGLFL